LPAGAWRGRPFWVSAAAGAIGHLAVQQGARVIIAVADSQCRLEFVTGLGPLPLFSHRQPAGGVVRFPPLRPGEIVLMHVGSNPDDHTTFDADALPQVITELRARGYSFVTLDVMTR
jgi:hypothetical protein